MQQSTMSSTVNFRLLVTALKPVLGWTAEITADLLTLKDPSCHCLRWRRTSYRSTRLSATPVQRKKDKSYSKQLVICAINTSYITTTAAAATPVCRYRPSGGRHLVIHMELAVCGCGARDLELCTWRRSFHAVISILLSTVFWNIFWLFCVFHDILVDIAIYI